MDAPPAVARPIAEVAATDVSVVAPARDEAPNIRPLHEELCAALGDSVSWEFLPVDDASEDGTSEAIAEIAALDARVRGVRLEEPRGQSAAVLAGADRARAPLIATLDADLQNDPADLPRLLALLVSSGADLVTGVRTRRADGAWRRLSSKVANGVRRVVLDERFRDSACGIKVVRRNALLALEPFEGMHRFLPVLIERGGGVVLEAPVRHRPRAEGTSKYTARNRLVRATRDMLRIRSSQRQSSTRSMTKLPWG